MLSLLNFSTYLNEFRMDFLVMIVLFSRNLHVKTNECIVPSSRVKICILSTLWGKRTICTCATRQQNISQSSQQFCNLSSNGIQRLLNHD